MCVCSSVCVCARALYARAVCSCARVYRSCVCVASSVCVRAHSSACVLRAVCLCAVLCCGMCVLCCVVWCVLCVCVATAACVCVLLLHAPHTVCTPACIACSSFYYLADTNVHAHARTIMCVPRSQGELQMNSTALDELKQQVQYIRRVRARGVYVCMCMCCLCCCVRVCACVCV